MEIAPSWKQAILEVLYPPFGDKRFWIVQFLVLLMAILHLAADVKWVVVGFGIPNFATVSLFLIPIVYAALNFGRSGSIATALWAIILTIPDLLLVDSPADVSSDLISLVILVGVAIFVGGRIQTQQMASKRIKNYAKRLLIASEEERKRISHELHDEPVQALIGLARKLEAIAALNNIPDLADSLKEVQTLALDTEANLRAISRGLRPPSLDDLGLVAALLQLSQECEDRTLMEIEVTILGENSRLDSEIELAVFRIAQEALRNSEKHAAARKVDIHLEFKAKLVSLLVTDDGIGFLPEEQILALSKGSLGIMGMQERAELIGGVIKIESAPQKGTKVFLTVPQ